MRKLILSLFLFPCLASAQFNFADPTFVRAIHAETLAFDLVAYWKMNDVAGTNFVDSSTNALAAGQLVNGPVATNGVFDGAFFFDGANDFGLVTNITKFYITNSFSLAFSGQMDTTGQSSIYFMTFRDATDDVWGFIYGFTANKFEFYSGRFTGTSPRTPFPGVITDTAWHRYGVTYDGTTLIGYLDGNAITNRAISFSLNNTGSSQIFRIATSTGSANFLKGKLDHIKVYRRALSASEMARDTIDNKP